MGFAGSSIVVPSAAVIDFRYPIGVPLRAGKNFAVIGSPILSTLESAAIPCAARTATESVVNVHTVVLPSRALTNTVTDPCGLTNKISTN